MGWGGKRKGAGGGKARPRAGAERVPDPNPHGNSLEGRKRKKNRLPQIGKGAPRKNSAASHPAFKAKLSQVQDRRRRGRPASYQLPTAHALHRVKKANLLSSIITMRERLWRRTAEAANFREKCGAQTGSS